MTVKLFSKTPTFDFMGKRWLGFTISGLLTLLSIGLVFTKGLNLGIDFTGGILMEIHTEKPTELGRLREALGKEGFGEVSLQDMGDANSLLIRIQVGETDEQSKVVAKVKDALSATVPGNIDYRKIDFVGPTIGDELIEAGVMAVLFSFAAIMVYVWFRFEWQYGAGAILSLIHDSVMVIGFFAVTQLDFGLPAVAAILTIIGYSINDTVVIFDRIRENMRRFKKKEVFDLINISINETLSRTILTAGTTFLAALALALFGGDVIASFSWAMVFGVVVGCYSSIYISAPTLYYMNIRASAQEEQEQAV